VPKKKAHALRAALLDWYAAVRRDLPWRRTSDPYAIWLSEIMLQQTRVDTVIPYYERFLSAFPTVHTLAEAPLDDVLAMWSGLGYYRRARMMHAGARVVAESGAFPEDVEGLRRIPGIGAYTAGAIASIAFALPAALVDGNVARVFARLFAIEDDLRGGAGLARVWALAEDLVAGVATGRAGDWNQALMELGATVCVPREPRCDACPVRDHCDARARGLASELPRLKAKTAPVSIRRAALVSVCDGKVLLARRHTGAVFGGMWEPPSIDVALDREDVVAWATPRFADLLGGRTHVASLEQRGTLTHVLSHRRMHVNVLSGTLTSARASVSTDGDYDRSEWVRLEDLEQRGMTTLAMKILRVAGIER
jgi:A/G-specific adenine glycosylase